MSSALFCSLSLSRLESRTIGSDGLTGAWNVIDLRPTYYAPFVFTFVPSVEARSEVDIYPSKESRKEKVLKTGLKWLFLDSSVKMFAQEIWEPFEAIYIL